ncbi:MAG: phosphatidylglycerophosphatase A [Desulfobacterales bacterium]
MKHHRQSILFLATGFYVGYIPFAPGTFGTLAGLPFCLLFALTGTRLAVLLTLLFVGFAIVTAHQAEKYLEKKDPGLIVIDEMAGILVTFLLIPLTPETAVLGFYIFRILDIAKPFPIRYLEKRVPGGTGIVLDDVIAGIFGNLILRGILIFWTPF